MSCAIGRAVAHQIHRGLNADGSIRRPARKGRPSATQPPPSTTHAAPSPPTPPPPCCTAPPGADPRADADALLASAVPCPPPPAADEDTLDAACLAGALERTEDGARHPGPAPAVGGPPSARTRSPPAGFAARLLGAASGPSGGSTPGPPAPAALAAARAPPCLPESGLPPPSTLSPTAPTPSPSR